MDEILKRKNSSGPWITEPKLCRPHYDKYVFVNEMSVLGKNNSRLWAFHLGSFHSLSLPCKSVVLPAGSRPQNPEDLSPEVTESIWGRRQKPIAMSAKSEEFGRK